MIQNFIHKILLRRHFWRYATLSEVAELYASRVMRISALSIMNVFMSIYLYQLGYSVAQIGLYWACFFLFKVIVALPIAKLVAWIGPKHATLLSNLLYIPAMVAFVLIPAYGSGVLILTLMLQGASAAMYSIAYAIDFSKVKSLSNAGKEIAYMNIFEKIASGLSPLLGGIMAYLWGPQIVLIIAAMLFALAALPLFRTGEPVRVKQKLKFDGFPWRLLFRHSFAQFGYGFDVFASGTVWSLYVAVLILGISSNSNDVYAITGALLSVVFIVSLASSYSYGKLIDHDKGGSLMHTATMFNAFTHFLRPFIVSPMSVAGLNAANELATTGYTLPYTRAVFDNADLSGSRTAYLGMTEMIANLGAFVGAVVLSLGAFLFGEEISLRSFFFVAAVVVLLILTARFPLYNK